jgi:Arc/MetJ-type ribon-helix-helix transcriptional regulator
MKIRLRPETEERIKQDIQSGAYQSMEEFVACTISLLHEQKAWLAENREEIRAKIAEGYAEAQRGELIAASDVLAQMEERKHASLADDRDRLPDSQEAAGLS